AVDFDLADLEIRRLGTQRFLRGDELSAVVEVDDAPVTVLVADVELADLRVVALLQAVARIAREPAPRVDPDLRPVVHRVVDALGFPPALPARRHAGAAAHGDEQDALDAAVALAARHAREREAGDRAVLLLGVITDVGVDPMEDLADLHQRIGL